MLGHARSRLARAARFHLISIGGIIDTFTLAATVHYVLKVAAFWARAVALPLAVVFDFTLPRIFTHRRIERPRRGRLTSLGVCRRDSVLAAVMRKVLVSVLLAIAQL